jgi:hypothetical protein
VIPAGEEVEVTWFKARSPQNPNFFEEVGASRREELFSRGEKTSVVGMETVNACKSWRPEL